MFRFKSWRNWRIIRLLFLCSIHAMLQNLAKRKCQRQCNVAAYLLKQLSVYQSCLKWKTSTGRNVKDTARERGRHIWDCVVLLVFNAHSSGRQTHCCVFHTSSSNKHPHYHAWNYPLTPAPDGLCFHSSGKSGECFDTTRLQAGDETLTTAS